MATVCWACGGDDTTYQAFSGGQEYYCRTCEDSFPYREDSEVPPRVLMLRTDEGREALAAEMLAHFSPDTEEDPDFTEGGKHV